MNAWTYVAAILAVSGGLGALVNIVLLALKEESMGAVEIVYRRGTQYAAFTLVGRELRESWDGHPYRVLFRSELVEDLMMRMEHRDEVLRRQGFTSPCPWRKLFEVDATVPVE